MNNTEELSVPVVEKSAFFQVLLRFYPEPYRKRFGEQMLLVLSDMYQEELETHGKVGIWFWLMQLSDMGKSITYEHIDLLQKQGVSKYIKYVLHVNKYNTLGFILLLPFVSIFALDFITRLLQWDLIHPNKYVLHGLYNTPLYWFPVLFTWVLLFPILAIALNVIPLLKSVIKKHNHIVTLEFFQKNIVGIIILTVSLLALTLLAVHDSIGCVFYRLMQQGLGHFFQIASYCHNAA